MTFCYAPQVQAEPSFRPSVLPTFLLFLLSAEVVFADRLSLGPDLGRAGGGPSCSPSEVLDQLPRS